MDGGGAAGCHIEVEPIHILQKWAIRDVVGKKRSESTRDDFVTFDILAI